MKKHHNQFVRCVENIQDLSGQAKFEYALILAGGFAHSKKTIKYDIDNNINKGKFEIHNHIDDTNEVMTISQFRKSLMGRAMKMRCLIALID